MDFDVFVDGAREQEDGRQYVILTDFPVPIPVGDKGVYIKRTRIAIDVTGLGLPDDADQAEFEEWLDDEPGRSDDLSLAVMHLACEVAASSAVRAEAKNLFDGLGRTIQ